MNSTAHLSGSHLRTYTAIFQHPASHNLSWHDVHALFRHLGKVDEEPNGNLKVTRNGQTIVLHAPRTKDVAEIDELMGLRHFLERSEPEVQADGSGSEWLIVLNHREGRIFKSIKDGTAPQQILPHEPEDQFRHAHHAKDFSRGQEKPDPNSFFEPIAKEMQSADKVLIFGTGTGMSSEMDQFNAWIDLHQPELRRRIVDSVTVDESHLTDGQLLAKARVCYAQRAPLKPMAIGSNVQ